VNPCPEIVTGLYPEIDIFLGNTDVIYGILSKHAEDAIDEPFIVVFKTNEYIPGTVIVGIIIFIVVSDNI